METLTFSLATYCLLGFLFNYLTLIFYPELYRWTAQTEIALANLPTVNRIVGILTNMFVHLIYLGIITLIISLIN